MMASDDWLAVGRTIGTLSSFSCHNGATCCCCHRFCDCWSGYSARLHTSPINGENIIFPSHFSFNFTRESQKYLAHFHISGRSPSAALHLSMCTFMHRHRALRLQIKSLLWIDNLIFSPSSDRLWSSGCRSRYQGGVGRLKFLRRPFCIIGELLAVIK